MESRNLFLRILYTINSSPQYILARSVSAVQVSLLEPDLSQPAICYGTVSLKTCLSTICRSSPELIQDLSRDYTVYVLDPLESNSAPALVNISNASSHETATSSTELSRGVAVGLGLMSWALQAVDNESTPVTGTLIKLKTGQEALEVIFALRETAALERSSLSEALRTWGLAAPTRISTPTESSAQDVPNLSGMQQPQLTPFDRPPTGTPEAIRQPSSSTTTSTSQLLEGSRASKPRARTTKSKPAKSIPFPTSEADKLMLSEETYIGPIKKKGRPLKNPDDEKKVSRPSSSHSNHYAGPFSRVSQVSTPRVMPSDAAPDLAQGAILPPQQGSQSTSQSAVSAADASNTWSLLNVLSYLAKSKDNAALLSVLGAIDCSSSKPNDVNTTNRALVDALKDLLQNPGGHAHSGLIASSSQSFEHRRRSSHENDVVHLDKENVNPAAFANKNERGTPEKRASNPDTPSTPTKPAPAKRHASWWSTNVEDDTILATAKSNEVERVKRKRTLSEFMDERGAKGKSQTKGRTGQGTDSQLSAYRRLSYDANNLRHYPRFLSEGQPREMPSTRSHYRTGMEPWTSPPRTTDVRASDSWKQQTFYHNPQNQPIVIPDSPPPSASASSPIRSNAALQPKRRYVVPEWARTETSTRPRLSAEAQRALEEAEQKKRKERETRKKSSRRRDREKDKDSGKWEEHNCTTTTRTGPNPQPKTCEGDGQGNHIPQPIAATGDCDIFSNPLSQSSQSSVSDIPLPSTPRTSGNREPSSPDFGSLFTPVPKAPEGHTGSGSPLFTPQGKSVRQHKPAFGTDSSPSPSFPSRHQKGLINQKESEVKGIPELDYNALERELDSAFEELDSIHSDVGQVRITTDPLLSSSPNALRVSDRSHEEPDELDMALEHQSDPRWAELPPSSPPPPTSPLSVMPGSSFDSLRSDDEDMDEVELPVATSDAEDCSDMNTSTSEPSPINDVDGIHDNDALDLFAQFTHLSSSPDGAVESEKKLGWGASHNGLADFDFTEFWESFRPLVQGQTGEVTSTGMQDIDHSQLAAEVQALFSGCLM